MYAQFFGTFLLSHNVVTKDQLLSALGKKSSQHMKLGTLAIMKGSGCPRGISDAGTGR